MRIIPVEQKYKEETINIALDTLRIGKQAFIFVNTKRSAEKVAEDISKKIKDIDLEEVSYRALNALARPTKQCERLAACIKRGVAFHHAGLVAKQRELIEDEFRNGRLKLICCTPTLAAGVDLPAFRTIIRDLKRYGTFGLSWIPVLEYMQQSGRAGRPKFDSFGESIAIADTESEKEEIRKRYILGEPEDIQSKLAVEPVLRTYLLSLIAANYVNTKTRIREFFSKTFWAHQFEDMARIELMIDKMLNLLEEWEFIRIAGKGNDNEIDFVSAAEIEVDARISATPIGKRVAELYIDPFTAHYLMENIRKTASADVHVFALLHLISNTLEMRPLLAPRQKDFEKINDTLAQFGERLLEKEPSMFEPEYDTYLASIKTAMFLGDWIEEKDEEYLREEYSVRPGEINSKLAIAEWLLYSAEELARMMQFKDVIKDLKKANFRLQHGIKEELIPLVRLRGIGRVRARKLYNNKIKDLLDVKKSDYARLKSLLGESVAKNIKEQVGEDIDKIPVKPGRRKGQIALEDFDE